MALRGKSINLYLMDGDPNGRAKCTLANWTGVAYKIPRIDIDKCKDREDLKQGGVYFLFGTSDTTGKNVVYIGQAGARKNGEGILNRLQEHRQKRAFFFIWNEWLRMSERLRRMESRRQMDLWSTREAIFHLRMIIPSLLRLKRKERQPGSTRMAFFWKTCFLRVHPLRPCL